MRDRLRSVSCPSEVIDQIGGWRTEGIGAGYGLGHQLEDLQYHMEKMSRQHSS